MIKNKGFRTAIKLIISLAVPLTIGGIAGIFTAESVPEWYATLNKPSFNPPDWIFGPVWTFLYLVMGWSLYLIWEQASSRARNMALIAFGIQLTLNFGWSFFFFYFKMPGLALAEIIVLWLSILFMLYFFHRIRPWAAYSNIPYLLWVSFATILNAAYYSLN